MTLSRLDMAGVGGGEGGGGGGHHDPLIYNSR